MKPKRFMYVLLASGLICGTVMLSCGAAAFDGDGYTVAENEEAVEAVVNPVTPDDDGTLVIEDDMLVVEDDMELLDFVIPETVNGQTITVIGSEAFRGSELFRTVTIPRCVTEIGDSAFADCPNLQYIILEDRYDEDGLTLGEDWCGDAEVLYGLVLEANKAESTVGDTTSPLPSGDVYDNGLDSSPVENDGGTGEESSSGGISDLLPDFGEVWDDVGSFFEGLLPGTDEEQTTVPGDTSSGDTSAPDGSGDSSTDSSEQDAVTGSDPSHEDGASENSSGDPSSEQDSDSAPENATENTTGGNSVENASGNISGGNGTENASENSSDANGTEKGTENAEISPINPENSPLNSHFSTTYDA